VLRRLEKLDIIHRYSVCDSASRVAEVCPVVLVVSSRRDETSDALVASSNTAQGHDFFRQGAKHSYSTGGLPAVEWGVGSREWEDD
jgi:hypothetical protein